MPVRLAPLTEQHVQEMATWFSNERELTEWAGPGFRYPFDLQTFIEDLKLEKLSSFVLLSDDDEFIGFGQYYLRHGRCHLGRLVIAPQYRGGGYAAALMDLLIARGLKELNVDSSSLFVLEDNAPAIRAYQKFGFSFAEYPEEIPMENCLYMIR